ncbi:4'-phosphopantetheinyl transferase family protein [Aliamphritea hakodatensis]|uniref:4'-phosphopantetheinyl transferase family protein n=1 Tax=Aliamphritea hakodatensis TaxID=2895352 RepID=UPI0022FD6AA0|nr:4'-phosphopantetheinyl transferase superfamily protein [Aliamphritea hakodatensis]
MPADLQGAVLKRQCEYLAGRYCAVQAMGMAGILNPEPPLRGSGGAPIWPAGIRGSISHSCQQAVAILCRTDTGCAGLGVDIEGFIADDSLDTVMPLVLQTDEWLLLQSYHCRRELLTVAFSVKEAFYKAIYPYICRFADFHEVVITGLGKGRAALTPRAGLAAELPKNILIQASYRMGSCGVESRVVMMRRAEKGEVPETFCEGSRLIQTQWAG